jgi:hypothetical protein
MEYVNMFIILTYVIVLFIVYRYQTAVIKGQKDLNKTLTNKLIVLESFQKIIDIDTFTKYHEVLNKTYETNLYEAINSKTEDSVKAILNRAYQELPAQMREGYDELFEVTCKTLKILKDDEKEIFLMRLPINENLLREYLSGLKK